MSARFVGDAHLGYREQRFRFEPGARLVLDEAYRANQLPLFRPDHPGVIARRPGSDAVMGRYEASRMSAVVRLASEVLEESAAYRDLVARLRASPVGAKVDWAMAERRRDVLHATLRSDLERDRLSEAKRRLTSASGFGPVAVAIGGLWVGTAFNRGRLYLPLYPERRGDDDAFGLLQRRLGGRETRFYSIGLFNLVDDLDEVETAALGTVVEAGAGTRIAETTFEELALLETHDDLVLDGRAIETVRL